MRNCALLAAAGWAPTTGHHPGDHHPPRRIDRWYATWHLPDAAVRGHRTLDAAAVGTCTDHAPVVIEVDPAAIDEHVPARPPAGEGAAPGTR